jgi:predicted GNAT family acetyltransferase
MPTAAVARVSGSVYRLSETDEAEVLAFLSQRPVHTVVMTSFIIDNGIESELNRGDFYGYRNLDGELEAVALLGHTTLIEARNEFALEAIADTAREIDNRIHIIMSSGDTANKFWSFYKDGFEKPRVSCTELLFEVQYPYLVADTKYQLRNARPEDLMDVASAHAEIALLESGVDPMVTDRDGFLARVMRRIEQGRVFVAYEGDGLIFKADIIAEASDVIYLEGVYVAPGRRGEGIGPACLAQLTCELLKKVQNVCLLSNISFIDAHMSYLKAGYRNTGSCVTLFV